MNECIGEFRDSVSALHQSVDVFHSLAGDAKLFDVFHHFVDGFRLMNSMDWLVYLLKAFFDLSPFVLCFFREFACGGAAPD